MLITLLVSMLAGIFAPGPAVQSRAAVKLYVFDCGRLKSGNPDVLLARGVTTTEMSVTAYLIVHPRGTLLWDTGVIPDELIQPNGTTEARATVHPEDSLCEHRLAAGTTVRVASRAEAAAETLG